MLCHPDAVRHDHGALVPLLKLRFAPHETVNSLSAEFYARVQLDGETLAEYSRVLVGLRNRMEKAASTEAEGQALALLRNTALKYQFIEGVRRELRRVAFHSAGKPFHHMRNEVLNLLQRCARQGEYSSPIECRFLQMVQMQQQLQTQVVQLTSQQCETAGQIQLVVDQLPGQACQPRVRECPKKTTPYMPVTRRGRSCFGCKQEGHFVRYCPRKCGDEASGG